MRNHLPKTPPGVTGFISRIPELSSMKVTGFISRIPALKILNLFVMANYIKYFKGNPVFFFYADQLNYN